MRDSPEKRILVALDGSDRAFETVKYLSHIPAFQGMQVLLLNIFSEIPEEYWDLEKQSIYGKRLRAIRAWEMQKKKETQDYLEKARQHLLNAGFSENDVIFKSKKRSVGVARDIIEEAKKGYSAVVVGRKGKGAIKDLVLGSIATKLLEKLSFVPLMLVGRNASAEKILVALDGSDHSMKIIQYLSLALEGSKSQVTLIHVIRGEEQAYIEEAERSIKGVFDHAKKVLGKSGLGPDQIETRIMTGAESRAGAIFEEAKAHDYGTVVVGRRGLSKVQEFFMGRVSNKVVQLARGMAVWVVS
jgi:nucleotide-binding universal stress UspA family protein